MSFRPGAIGTLTGTLAKVEFKTTAKGKRWVSFTLKRGKQNIQMNSFVEAAVTGLEMFIEGEEISVFGKIVTQTNNDKHYTNFTALKLYDETQEDTGVAVSGEVVQIVANDYGFDVWVDTTENPAYPERVKFQVNKGVKLPFQEGEVISGAKLAPRGKFCFWTLDTGASPSSAPKDYNGKPVRDLSEIVYEREEQAPAAATDAPASDSGDADF